MKPVPPSPKLALQDAINRRVFLRRTATSAGTLALSALMNPASMRSTLASENRSFAFPPRAKRIIYLHQSGAPSHLDLFDHKPGLAKWRGKDLPASVRSGQRLTGMTSGYTNHAIFPSPFGFQQHGSGGVWMSELWPYLSRVANDLCVIKTLNTEAINHDPAITIVHTGSQIAGRPSFGSWLSYGLGSENSDLPAFIVMTSDGTGRPGDQPLYDRLWSARACDW